MQELKTKKEQTNNDTNHGGRTEEIKETCITKEKTNDISKERTYELKKYLHN